MTKKLFEVLTPKDDVKEWIRDFLDSNAPQFKGKSKKEKIKMALAAYYDAKRGSKKNNKKENLDENLGALVPIVKNVPKIAKNVPSIKNAASNSRGWWDYPSMAVNTLGIGALAANMGNEKPADPAKSNADYSPDPERRERAQRTINDLKAKALKRRRQSQVMDKANQPADMNDPVGRLNRLQSTVADMNKRFQNLYPDANIPDFNPTPMKSIESRMGPVRKALEKQSRATSPASPAQDKFVVLDVDGVPTKMLQSAVPGFRAAPAHKEMKISSEPVDYDQYMKGVETQNTNKINDKKPGEQHPGVGDKKTKKKVNDKKPGEQHPGVDYQQESYHWANNEDHEGEMILSQLMSISEKTAALSKKIDEDDQFEGWIQAKITKAEDYINSVYNYLMYNNDDEYNEPKMDKMKSMMPMIKMNIMKLKREETE